MIGGLPIASEYTPIQNRRQKTSDATSNRAHYPSDKAANGAKTDGCAAIYGGIPQVIHLHVSLLNARSFSPRTRGRSPNARIFSPEIVKLLLLRSFARGDYLRSLPSHFGDDNPARRNHAFTSIDQRPEHTPDKIAALRIQQHRKHKPNLCTRFITGILIRGCSPPRKIRC
jgi:hypothetical protein